MSWQAWFTLALIVATVYVPAPDLLPPAPVVLGASVIGLLAGVVTPARAFAGYRFGDYLRLGCPSTWSCSPCPGCWCRGSRRCSRRGAGTLRSP